VVTPPLLGFRRVQTGLFEQFLERQEPAPLEVRSSTVQLSEATRSFVSCFTPGHAYASACRRRGRGARIGSSSSSTTTSGGGVSRS
jgi:hypothetical protein